MGIYFRDILLTRISRGANNCGQHPLEKNIYFIMRFSPQIQLFYFNDRLEFCKFFEGKIKRINNADLFSQLPLLIFIKGANISGGHCIYIHTHTHTYIWFIEIVSNSHLSWRGQRWLWSAFLFHKKNRFILRSDHTLCYGVQRARTTILVFLSLFCCTHCFLKWLKSILITYSV